MEAKLTYQEGKLIVCGDFIRYDGGAILDNLISEIQSDKPAKVDIQNKTIGQWDSSLIAVLYNLVKAFPKTDFDWSNLPDGAQRLLRLACSVDRKPTLSKPSVISFLERTGQRALDLWDSVSRGISFLRQVEGTLTRWLRGKAVMRKIDFWLVLQDCAPKAVGIVSLISFMVGLILAFVGAIQLKSFGAQIYVASLVAVGMTRIMGAIMVGIIMAGRTGASYAATIGTMQVNEELDALQTMGIPKTDFLVLPRLLATVLAMPILVMLADLLGMIGGAAVGVGMLGLSPPEYWQYSVSACDMTNFLVGLFHGLVFGVVIALCGCYFGITCGRNSDSVGVATTRAVVYAIVWMIVMTGIITLICEVLGL